MARDERDYKLELSSLSQGGSAGAAASPTSPAAGRPFISVHFTCCGVYQRIYRSADGKSYQGRCPRCGVPVTFRVGAGGTDCRFFVVH